MDQEVTEMGLARNVSVEAFVGSRTLIGVVRKVVSGSTFARVGKVTGLVDVGELVVPLRVAVCR